MLCSRSFRSFSINGLPEKRSRGRQQRSLVHCTFILSTSSFALRTPAEFPVWCRRHLRCQRYLDCSCCVKRTPLTSPARNAQLALFGGAALFFITLIFPIQFDRQWITVGWALEGAALCWLFRRVPHPGLRLAGVGLLVVVFVRLALNPAVLSYHPRAAFPIFNWYLYTYGIATVCLFVAARLLAPPRNRVLGHNVQPLLYTLGTVLAFFTVNIEIADYFSTPGVAALTFQFSGNFARDMSYSIAWALFALLLLIVGIRKRIAATRYAGSGIAWHHSRETFLSRSFSA